MASNFSSESIRMYGIIYDIDPSISKNDLTSLVQECFSIQLYDGLNSNEVLFIANQTDYESPIQSLFEIYGDKLSIKIIDEKEKLFKIDIVSSTNKKIFIDQVQKVCGAQLIDDNHFKCVDYQIKLINKNNLNPIGSMLSEIKEKNELNERIANISLMINNNANESRLKPYEYYLNIENVELVLLEKDLLKIATDCIVTTFNKATSEMTSLTNYIYTQSDKKYQQAFKKNLDENLGKFLLPSNRITDASYVLNIDTSKLDSLNTIKDIYLELVDSYNGIFNTINSLKLTSLAMTFLKSDYFEINLIALCEAINSFSEKTNQNLNKIIIVSLDKKSLELFQSFLLKGYEKPTSLNEIDEHSSEEKCSKCSSNKFLLKTCNFHSTCESCEIIHQLNQISKKCLLLDDTTNELICFKCAVKAIIDDLKLNHCSSCLIEFNNNNRYFLNQSCSKHTVCVQCSKASNLLAVCHNCTFHKLYSKFSRINKTNDLMNNHNKFRCCYDFCESQSNLVQLECGHTSRCESSVILCLFCSVFNVFEMLANKYGIRLDKLNDNLVNNSNSFDNDDYVVDVDQIDTEVSRLESVKEEKGLKCYSKVEHLEESLSGYENFNTIAITFLITDGIQNKNHPRPGEKYYGCMKTIYLPQNQEGCQLCDKLIQLLEANRLFSLTESSVTKGAYIASCKDVTFKTSKSGGPEKNGYPDPNYIEILKEQLNKK